MQRPPLRARCLFRQSLKSPRCQLRSGCCSTAPYCSMRRLRSEPGIVSNVDIRRRRGRLPLTVKLVLVAAASSAPNRQSVFVAVTLPEPFWTLVTTKPGATDNVPFKVAASAANELVAKLQLALASSVLPATATGLLLSDVALTTSMAVVATAAKTTRSLASCVLLTEPLKESIPIAVETRVLSRCCHWHQSLLCCL